MPRSSRWPATSWNCTRSIRRRARSSTTRRKSGRRRSPACAMPSPKPGSRRRTSPASASPISAKPRSSGTAPAASRSTMPSSGRTGAPPIFATALREVRPRAGDRRQDRACARSLFFRQQDRLAAGQCGRRARSGRGRQARLRHHRQFPVVAADRRQSACDRCQQCRAHAAVRYRPRRMGCRPLRAVRRAALAAAAGASDCAGEFGATLPELFGAPIRILGMAGDQQAATVGQGCFTPGMMKSTYGTGCFMVLNTGAERVASRNRLLTTIAYQLDGKRTYALEGAIFIAGAAVQWLRDGLKIISEAPQVDALAGARRSGRAGLSGAGLCRPRRALLGRAGARRDLRPDAQLRRCRACPRCAGSGRLPDPRSARGHARRLAGRRPAPPACCGSTAA